MDSGRRRRAHRGGPTSELEALLKRTRRQGCARLLLVSLAVARTCAGSQLPRAVCHAIAADPIAEVLCQEVVGELFRDGRAEPRNDRIDAFRFRMRERWSDRLQLGLPPDLADASPPPPRDGGPAAWIAVGLLPAQVGH